MVPVRYQGLIPVAQPKNFVFYRGPSQIDGSPIVGIATLPADAGKANQKTGIMWQCWILRADMDPVEASRVGADVSICGACVHRGKYGSNGSRVEGTRSCYVQLYVPQNVWRTERRGSYDDLSESLDVASARVAGSMVRLGSYGDPAAIPFAIWDKLLSGANGHTGYTHQWRVFPEFNAFVMASCDSLEDRVAARVLGFRTFRVAPVEGWTKEAGEVLCPASKEAGKKTVCALCKACGGNASKAKADIMIPAHGGGKRLVS